MLYIVEGDINRVVSTDIIEIRNCPDYVDSCLYVCSDGVNNPCHPADLYSIAIDTSESGALIGSSQTSKTFKESNVIKNILI